MMQCGILLHSRHNPATRIGHLNPGIQINRCRTLEAMTSFAPRLTITLALAGMLLAGCATSGDTGAGALAMLPTASEPGQQAVSEDVLLAAMDGGIIGDVAGRAMSERDLRKAAAAEYRALETSPVGQSMTWANERSGLSGIVSAAAAYQVGSQNCRQYTHTVTGLGAAPVEARGTACRDDKGVWTPLS